MNTRLSPEPETCRDPQPYSRSGLGGAIRPGLAPGLLRDYVARILSAPVYEVAHETPLQQAAQLSSRLGNRILLKREDLQPVFSFKIRGAYAKLASLDAQARAAGVICASAGNHAQGLALAARHLQVKALIVMPANTPQIKVQGVRQQGAQVLLQGDSFTQALEYAQLLARLQGYSFIAPYDDPEVIAGQGTVAVELLRQQAELDAVFVPVGGGGLIAGVAAYLKYLNPAIRVVGVEAEGSACLKAALDSGKRVVLPSVDGFADGVAVAQVGVHNWALCRHLVDEVISVGNDEICAAIRQVYEDTRAITEPSGALAVAGLQRYVARSGCRDRTLVAITSGANINFASLRHVIERTEQMLSVA
ncbi:threonine ammonia-lyase, biosynthetic [Halopseudomonas phragmitis]|uniref:L-threonine dehydratase n=1 Tax=Halopseudomonas phragmitis TaxID=1931241 RepID=A0A1V0B3G7_9GAMM|nr:threonine ammonia-lyase, biosynthetic [Halopseudomonas phragmitis]AQZ94482.1 threonine ammonia-lyase, biosynthetic [Halopseudomonas phragmitis]